MKVVDAGFTGTHRYSFRVGEKARIVGVKMVQPDEGGDWRTCFEVEYFDGKRDYVPLWDPDATYDIAKFHEPTKEQIEIERLARLMCEKAHGSGSADMIVNRGQLPVIGLTGMRFILPGPFGQMPLWQDFMQAARTAIEDKET